MNFYFISSQPQEIHYSNIKSIVFDSLLSRFPSKFPLISNISHLSLSIKFCFSSQMVINRSIFHSICYLFMNKILVTGGAGFIGSHLIQQLVKDTANQVYSLDNYSSGSEANHVQGCVYLRGNTKDIAQIIDWVPNIIYHLGEYSRTSASFEDPVKVWDYNAQGTFQVVEFCRVNKVRLLYAGSSTKMSDNGDGRKQSPYAWTKSTNIDLINRYGQWYGLDYVIVYFYNVYGGREVTSGQYATVIASWKQKAKKGQLLPIVFPGTQQRAFTYIDDIVRGIILAGQKGKGDGYPLGAKQTFTLFELANMFGIGYKMVDERKGDRKTAVINLTLTEKDLGWSAQVKLKDHIKQFMAGLKKK